MRAESVWHFGKTVGSRSSGTAESEEERAGCLPELRTPKKDGLSGSLKGQRNESSRRTGGCLAFADAERVECLTFYNCRNLTSRPQTLRGTRQERRGAAVSLYSVNAQAEPRLTHAGEPAFSLREDLPSASSFCSSPSLISPSTPSTQELTARASLSETTLEIKYTSQMSLKNSAALD